MPDRTLDNYRKTLLRKRSGGSSSYFDFVEKKAKEEFAVTASKAMELAQSGKDAFVVQVMDEETTEELKRRYFQQHDFGMRR